jgi:hypothetical protein
VSFRGRALTVIGFAIAMAYLEAAVVAYLQKAIGITPSQLFPLQKSDAMGDFAAVEVGREFATLVMLATIGMLAGSQRVDRLAWTSVAFGIWDIFYYVFLWVLLGWPTSPSAWDVLFLIPVPWAGPVWAPVTISTLLVSFGLVAARRSHLGAPPRLTMARIGLGAAGGLIVIISFTIQAPGLSRGEMPGDFAWPIFIAGCALAGWGATASFTST